MTSAALSFIVACVVAVTLTPLVRALCLRERLTEGADHVLKVHSGNVPRLGGIAIAIAFFVPILGVFALGAGVTVHFDNDRFRLVAFLLGGVAIFALGLWDDLRGLGATVKFSVEVAVAIALWGAGFRVEVLRLPGIGLVDLGAVGLLVTILWIVGVTNALNLVDGLDGLAAGVAFFAALAHLVVGVVDGDAVLVLFAAALAGSVLGFLPHNFHPARIFMGDSGSLFLGYMLAATSIYGASRKTSTAVALLGPVLILGLPILDTSLAVLRRARRGVPLFDGDREHVHHRLLALGMSHRRTVVLLYVLCAAFALTGLVTLASSSLTVGLVLASLLLVLAIFERRLGLLRRRDAVAVGPSLASLVRELQDALSSAPSPDAAWSDLVARAPALGVQRLRLVPAGDASDPPRSWERDHLPGFLREGTARVRVRAPRLGNDPERPPLLEIEKRPFRRGEDLAEELFALVVQDGLTRPLETPRRIDGTAAL